MATMIAVRGGVDLGIPARGGAPTTLRLTRRGRLVVGALAALTLVVFSLVIVLAMSGVARAAAPVDPARQVHRLVTGGETMWAIADQACPDRDPRDTILQIMDLNALASAQLRPGQELALPSC